MFEPSIAQYTQLCWFIVRDKDYWVCHKTNNTAGPEAWNFSFLCCYSTRNNTSSMPLFSTTLSVHWCWCWSFLTIVTLR
jgi:hypothetical protein